jgi:predicted acylesterase/phospholipase RssA
MRRADVTTATYPDRTIGADRPPVGSGEGRVHPEPDRRARTSCGTKRSLRAPHAQGQIGAMHGSVIAAGSLSPAGLCARLLLPLVLLAACAAPSTRVPPPAEAYRDVAPGGHDGLRYWADDLEPGQQARANAEMRDALVERWTGAGRPATGLTVDMLALSGGAADGAYGAGLLTGWTARGDRPIFDVVTGISVGALIAPFAFLGSDHDHALRTIFTELDTTDVAQLQVVRALFGALALARTDPLRAQIERFVDDAMLAEIAAAHRRGRRLLIGTTNIDAARPVVWNMGRIAALGELELFRDVLLASASIPGAFPPVPIAVEADDRRYTELHVDGGVTHAVTIGPSRAAEMLPRDLPFPVARTVYVIVNFALVPAYEPVADRLVPIVTRSLSTLIRAQSGGDLLRIHREAEAAGAAFRLTFLPPDFRAPQASAFDRAYMTALFETGAQAGEGGVDWLEKPPELLGRGAVERALGPAAPAAVDTPGRGRAASPGRSGRAVRPAGSSTTRRGDWRRGRRRSRCSSAARWRHGRR